MDGENSFQMSRAVGLSLFAAKENVSKLFTPFIPPEIVVPALSIWTNGKHEVTSLLLLRNQAPLRLQMLS